MKAAEIPAEVRELTGNSPVKALLTAFDVMDSENATRFANLYARNLQETDTTGPSEMGSFAIIYELLMFQHCLLDNLALAYEKVREADTIANNESREALREELAEINARIKHLKGIIRLTGTVVANSDEADIAMSMVLLCLQEAIDREDPAEGIATVAGILTAMLRMRNRNTAAEEREYVANNYRGIDIDETMKAYFGGGQLNG